MNYICIEGKEGKSTAGKGKEDQRQGYKSLQDKR